MSESFVFERRRMNGMTKEAYYIYQKRPTTGCDEHGLYVYMLYTFMLSTHYYTYKVVSMQLVHVKVAYILTKRVVRGSASG
jgi:hypothetical protein